MPPAAAAPPRDLPSRLRQLALGELLDLLDRDRAIPGAEEVLAAWSAGGVHRCPACHRRAAAIADPMCARCAHCRRTWTRGSLVLLLAADVDALRRAGGAA